jgi:hypothetical protein
MSNFSAAKDEGYARLMDRMQFDVKQSSATITF